jgi:hypothetical protein
MKRINKTMTAAKRSKTMPLANPCVVTEGDETFIRWGDLHYWIDDLNQATLGCIDAACQAVGESTDLSMLEAEIDQRVDETPGAEAVYIDWRNWE